MLDILPELVEADYKLSLSFTILCTGIEQVEGGLDPGGQVRSTEQVLCCVEVMTQVWRQETGDGRASALRGSGPDDVELPGDAVCRA